MSVNNLVCRGHTNIAVAFPNTRKKNQDIKWLSISNIPSKVIIFYDFFFI